MSAIKKVVVVGAGGNLGPFILSSLHSANFTISVLTRPDSNSTYPSYVTSVKTDYSHPSLLDAFRGQDAVISTVGFTGTSFQIQLIDAADQAGVKRFVPSEFGWAKDRPMLPELAARLEPKEKVFEHLLEKCRTSETMSWSAVATGPFLDWCLNIVPTLGFVVPKRTARIYDSGEEPLTCTTGAAIGTAVANILLNADKTANRYLKVCSVKATQNQFLEALEEATDTKWNVTRVSTKDIMQGRTKKLQEKKFQEAFLDLLTVQLFEDGAGRGSIVEPEKSDNELLGVKVEDVKHVINMLVSATEAV
ncbi:NAD(P)-binding protein [Glonium stellatum]|uniref:NAD(P)-binding protein n=1 Tax=Glonium stellatum TaxID=574774 RepID=A0A8E2ENT1_9PEZI|nr:NAD(P)-binding protein [Glonium stellatum]